MTGGGAMLRGLDRYLEDITKVPVNLAEDAVSCVAIGTGKVLDYIDKMEAAFSGDDISLIERRK